MLSDPARRTGAPLSTLSRHEGCDPVRQPPRLSQSLDPIQRAQLPRVVVADHFSIRRHHDRLHAAHTRRISRHELAPERPRARRVVERVNGHWQAIAVIHQQVLIVRREPDDDFVRLETHRGDRSAARERDDDRIRGVVAAARVGSDERSVAASTPVLDAPARSMRWSGRVAGGNVTNAMSPSAGAARRAMTMVLRE